MSASAAMEVLKEVSNKCSVDNNDSTSKTSCYSQHTGVVEIVHILVGLLASKLLLW
jgi:hypothetical protein